MRPERLGMIALGTIVAFVALSSLHPWGNPRLGGASQIPLAGADVPTDVRQVLMSKCADCHSASTHYPAYSRVAPVAWLVDRDIVNGRKALNLSTWSAYDLNTQAELLTRIGAEVRAGQMPVRGYVLMHPGARLSPAEQDSLYHWARNERKRVRALAMRQEANASADRRKAP